MARGRPKNRRETKFREKQGALPNGVWERGDRSGNKAANKLSCRALWQIREKGGSLANAAWLAWLKKLRLPLKKR